MPLFQFETVTSCLSFNLLVPVFVKLRFQVKVELTIDIIEDGASHKEVKHIYLINLRIVVRVGPILSQNPCQS